MSSEGHHQKIHWFSNVDLEHPGKSEHLMANIHFPTTPIWIPFGYHLDTIWIPYGYHMDSLVSDNLSARSDLTDRQDVTPIPTDCTRKKCGRRGRRL